MGCLKKAIYRFTVLEPFLILISALYSYAFQGNVFGVSDGNIMAARRGLCTLTVRA